MPVSASSQQEFSDADWRAVSSGDQSKKLKFLLSAISANTTRVWTLPDADVTISAFVATLLDDADAAAFLTTLGFEYGSNANGEYLRDGFGNQICWAEFDASALNATTATGSLFVTTGGTTITFPASFSSAPRVAVAGRRGADTVIGASLRSVSTSSMSANIWASLSANNTISKWVNYIAVGRV